MKEICDLMDHDQAQADAAMRDKGTYRRTFISYDALFVSEPFQGLTDAAIARKVGVATAEVKALRNRGEASTETIRRICEYLHCQPEDFMVAVDVEVVSAVEKK